MLQWHISLRALQLFLFSRKDNLIWFMMLSNDMLRDLHVVDASDESSLVIYVFDWLTVLEIQL